ncbi:TetR/AcrR family transcriptional regulator [Pseudomonas chlororaphis]|uniref:TetR/AcrR family transcriptional regulator n=1 Tax=Pseudomonas chlororaphis TaxID=587753 RepID=UPI001B33A171|nr:TetR/AcrR family transcriptional regulator [Pseudomonas chlororaphis]MBP5074673.1 TetR/AcrR family transcriptional regulator [Pseudomonas chlororaphis]
MRPANPLQREAKRTALLDAAAQCFAEAGFVATRTADICSTAGMSSGNLFHYFSSKHELLLALIAREGEETAAAMAALVAAEDPMAALSGFLEHVCQLASDRHYAGLALEISALGHRDEAVAHLVKANDLVLREGLAALVDAAGRAGQLHTKLSPEQAATWLAALIDGLFARVAADPLFNPQDQSQVLQQLVAHLLQGR